MFISKTRRLSHSVFHTCDVDCGALKHCLRKHLGEVSETAYLPTRNIISLWIQSSDGNLTKSHSISLLQLNEGHCHTTSLSRVMIIIGRIMRMRRRSETSHGGCIETLLVNLLQHFSSSLRLTSGIWCISALTWLQKWNNYYLLHDLPDAVARIRNRVVSRYLFYSVKIWTIVEEKLYFFLFVMV